MWTPQRLQSDGWLLAAIGALVLSLLLAQPVALASGDPGPTARQSTSGPPAPDAPNEWTNLNAASAPSARSGYAIAYDSLRNRVLVFGGWTTGFQSLNDTWSYDPVTNQWTNLNPAVHPNAMAGEAQMVYDSAVDRLILYGGSDVPFSQNRTWEYDPAANVWRDLNSRGPIPSHDFSMVFDPVADRTVLFGGGDRAPHFWADGSNATWAYDYNTNRWTDRNPATSPQRRWGHSAAYDAATDLVVLFGGCVTVPWEICKDANDLWVYDYQTNTWTERVQTSRPSPRLWAPMAYDPTANRMILFGGSTIQGAAGDTWVYDYVGDTWTNQTPTTSPDPRARGGMVFDSLGSGVVLFGGSGAATFLNDTWRYTFGPFVPRLPSAPRNLRAGASPHMASLTWQPPFSDGGHSISGYRIYRGTAPGGETILNQIGVATSYDDSGLTTLQTYYYRVSALNDLGEGPLSNEASATPPDVVNPTVEITNPTNGSILPARTVTISGTASDDIAVGKVEVSTDRTNWVQASGTTSWSVTLTLQEGHSRLWAVVTDTSGNTGAATINVTVVSQGPPSGGSPPSGSVVGAVLFAAVAITAAVVVGLVLRRRAERKRSGGNAG